MADGQLETDPPQQMPQEAGGEAAPQLDPSMTGQEDPMAGGDPNAMGSEDPMAGGEEGGDSTMDIINQLSPTDREAVRAYAESMLARDETSGGEEMEAGAPAQAGPQNQGVMMEITKGRLMNVQRRLNEAFGDMVTNSDRDETGRTQKKVKKNRSGFRSPFDSPFN